METMGNWGFMVGVALVLMAPTGGAAQQTYTPDELSEMPSIKSVEQAQQAVSQSYPVDLWDAGIGGRVQLRFVVRPDGSVDPASIEVMAATQAAFGTAAAAAVAGIEFKPGKKDGEAVRTLVVMPISFTVS